MVSSPFLNKTASIHGGVQTLFNANFIKLTRKTIFLKVNYVKYQATTTHDRTETQDS